MILLDPLFEGNKKLYKCKVKDVKLNRWRKNRQPDMSRVDEIRARNSEHVPNVIYTWKAPDNKFYVYDGAHRWEAIRRSLNGTFWMAVLETNDEKIIEEEFLSMNKAVPVPDLYLQPDDTIKLMIMEIVARLVRDHKSISSPSRNPRKPGFNRDVLTDLLYDELLDYESDSLTIEEVEKASRSLEFEYGRAELKKSIKDKCLKANCHLFAFGMAKFVRDLTGRVVASGY